MSEILASHVSGHPIIYNHYLTENVQRIQKRRAQEKLRARLKTCSDAEGVLRPNMKVEQLVNILAEPDTEADMEIVASSAATDVTHAYYQVCYIRCLPLFLLMPFYIEHASSILV